MKKTKRAFRARKSVFKKSVKEFGRSKVLLHFGGKSAEKSGLLGRVRESLKSAGIDFVELGGVHPNPPDDLVYQGIELCKKAK